MVANSRVRCWIRNRDLKDVLLGQNGCFVPDLTFKDKHDVILIFNQVLEMLQESELDHSHFEKRLRAALSEIDDNNELADVIKCLKIVEDECEQISLIDRGYLSRLTKSRLKGKL